MNKTTLGGIALLIGAGALAYLLPRDEPQPDPIARYNATEAMYADKSAFSERVQSIDDPEIMDHLTPILFNISFSSSMQRDRDYPEVEIAYAPHQLAAVAHYPDLEVITETYLTSAYAEWSSVGDEGMIWFQQPFQYPFGWDLTPKTVTLSDGQVLNVGPNEDPDAIGLQAFPMGGTRNINIKSSFGGDLPAAVSAVYSARFDTPSSFATLDFPNVKVGDAQAYDDYVITITDLTARFAEATLTRRDGGAIDGTPIRIEIGANDADRHPIQSGAQLFGALAGSLELRKSVEAIIDLAPTDIQAARQMAADLAKDDFSLVTQNSVRGIIDSLVVYVIDQRNERTFTRDIKVPIFPQNQYRGDEFREHLMTRDVIDTDLLLLTDGTPDAFTARDLRRDLTSWQDGTSLYFALPPRVSDLFIDKFDRFDPSGHLDFGRRNRSIDHDDWSIYSIQSMRIDFDPDAFPTTPQNISGKVVFQIVEGITRETHSIDALPDGITVNGNRITLSGDIYDAFTGRAVEGGYSRHDGDTIDSALKVIALNADGKPLKQFHAFSNQDSRGPKVDLYVYGNPTAVLVLRRGALTEVTHRIDQDLNPLLYALEQY